MPSLHHRDQWRHHARYQQYPHGFLRDVTDSTHASTRTGSGVRNTECQDESTELLNEIETTDQAIGDVTAETMLTTLGKIPNEMYYMEDTTMTNTKTKPHELLPTTVVTSDTTPIHNIKTTRSRMLATTVPSDKPTIMPTIDIIPTTTSTTSTSTPATATTAAIAATSGFAAHSTLFLALALALLFLLVLCCIIACIISRVRKGYSFTGEDDVECDQCCSGVNQPLLSSSKESNPLTKSAYRSPKK